MVSFYIHDGAQALILQISGALTQGAAAELEQTWITARSTLAGRELLVDLGDVISVDADGQTVLRRLAGHGARFITASRLTEGLAAEVSRRMPELLPAPRPSVWNRLACAAVHCFETSERSHEFSGHPQDRTDHIPAAALAARYCCTVIN
jgi:hypothetical protein